MRKRRLRGFRPSGEHLHERCLPSGYTPSQIASAYGLSAITFPSSSGTNIAGDGTGQTIAIIDLYHDPNLQASLNTFDAAYGLPAVTVDVIDQAGNQTDPGWATEETLDVEWAHAIAPGASIAVVEASPGTTSGQEFNNLLSAVQTASQISGVSVVSMSWGYGEFPDEMSYDSNFTTTGITYIAASGDDGTVEWPATSANVLAVGGTSLKLDAGGGYGSETGWSQTGGGFSTEEAEPTYQDTVQTAGDRSTPDVSFDGDPNTGVELYVIPPNNTAGQGSWEVVGGTSLGAPAWAGIIAIVDQGRVAAGLAPLTGSTQTLPAIYALSSTDFNKAPEAPGSEGSNTAIELSGYNTQAGLGSPDGAAFIAAMVDNTTTSPAPTPTTTPSPSPTSSAGVPPGLLPTPRPIPVSTPLPTPITIMGPTPTPLPTPTPTSTPPPAPPPQPAPTTVSKHQHHVRVRSAKPTPIHHQPMTRHRSPGKIADSGKKGRPESNRHARRS